MHIYLYISNKSCQIQSIWLTGPTFSAVTLISQTFKSSFHQTNFKIQSDFSILLINFMY